MHKAKKFFVFIFLFRSYSFTVFIFIFFFKRKKKWNTFCSPKKKQNFLGFTRLLRIRINLQIRKKKKKALLTETKDYKNWYTFFSSPFFPLNNKSHYFQTRKKEAADIVLEQCSRILIIICNNVNEKRIFFFSSHVKWRQFLCKKFCLFYN